MITNNTTVTSSDITKVSTVLEKLIVQGKYAHLTGAVNSILSGALIPTLIEQGKLDADDPAVKELLNSMPDKEVTRVVRERPVYRRIKAEGVNKLHNKERELSTEGRDVLIKWWNVNQRLIPKDDPVCVTLTAQINALTPRTVPLSAMQIAGYFSHLCRMGLRTEEDRYAKLNASRRRGAHTIMPIYTQALLEAIQKNWEFERANEQAIIADHDRLLTLRKTGVHVPVIASV